MLICFHLFSVCVCFVLSLCVCEYTLMCEHAHACTHYVHTGVRGYQKGVNYIGTWHAGNCALACGCCEVNLSSLHEQKVFLNSDSSLQAH